MVVAEMSRRATSPTCEQQKKYFVAAS